MPENLSIATSYSASIKPDAIACMQVLAIARLPVIIIMPADIEAVTEVEKALEPVSAKWLEIGVILGLNYKKLKGLRISDEDTDERINKVAKWWLEETKENKVFGAPSWKKLVGAIGARIGGGYSVYAAEIAKQHPLTSQ